MRSVVLIDCVIFEKTVIIFGNSHLVKKWSTQVTNNMAAAFACFFLFLVLCAASN
jgi:hypothetical protein